MHTYIHIIIYILYTQPVVLYLFNSFHFSVTVFYLKYIIFSLGLLKVQPCLGFGYSKFHISILVLVLLIV